MKIGFFMFSLGICLNSVVFSQSLDTFTPLAQPVKDEYRPKKDPTNIPGPFGENLDLSVTISFPYVEGNKQATKIVTTTLYNSLVFMDAKGVMTGGVDYYLR